MGAILNTNIRIELSMKKEKYNVDTMGFEPRPTTDN